MGATAAIAMIGLGAGVNASAQKQAGKSQQALANYNADINDIKANDALARGQNDELRHRLSTNKLIGSQRAAFAASGVDITGADSTAVNVFADTAALSEIDALTIRSNAAREAWGYRTQAQDDRARGRIAKQTGDNQAIGTLIGAGSTALYTKYGFGSTTRKVS